MIELNAPIIGQFRCCLILVNFLKEQYTTESKFFSPNSIPFINSNLVSGKSILQNIFRHSWRNQKKLDNGIFTCGVFIDLEKAFDTVNHNILLSKLDHYGIRDNALNWIRSYLTNQTQFVKLNGSESKNGNICCGVPQGSILGPLLFTIYINDMHQAVSSSKMHHFADDTNILLSNNTVDKNIKQRI